jgi:replicative DNA helicase
LSEAVKNLPVIPAQETGFEVFDKCLSGGFRQGDLIIISGPTQNGKTTFAQTLTYHLAKREVSSLWFSYEMGLREIWDKFKAMGVNDKFLAYVPFKLTNDNVSWIEKKVVEAKALGVKAVFIDHLGFLSGTPKKMTDNYSQNLSAYLGSVCREIKIMAVKHDVMIFLLAHTRKTDKPTLNDISSSAGIAQEANTVFMVWRERLDVDDDGEDVLSDKTKIALEKNRSTGMTKRIMCKLENGKLEQVPFEKKEKKEFTKKRKTKEELKAQEEYDSV